MYYMTMPATYDINYYRGDSFSMVLYPKMSSSVAFDLTGFSSIMNISNELGEGTENKWSTTITPQIKDNYIICVIPPSVGIFFSSEKTYYYDVKILKEEEEIVYTILTGQIKPIDSVISSSGES